MRMAGWWGRGYHTSQVSKHLHSCFGSMFFLLCINCINFYVTAIQICVRHKRLIFSIEIGVCRMKYYFCEPKLGKGLLFFLKQNLRSTLYFIVTPYFNFVDTFGKLLLILSENWSQVAHVLDEWPQKIVRFQLNNKYNKVTLVRCWFLY